MNTLYYGDNLDILRRYVADESVDLVYLDPPFNSNATYNILYDEQDGSRAAAQIKAFEDTWTWDQVSSRAYQDVVEAGGTAGRALEAFRTFLGESNLMAYLAMMAPRLIELRRVLKPTGSIYLHCDPTASHYLKMLMDAVLGPASFRNEIAWCYTGPSNTKNWFPRKHDILLFYVKDPKSAVFYADAVRVPYKAESFTMGGGGSLAAKNREGDYTTGMAEQLAKGKVVEDYWIDVASLSVSSERLGYPTQKPQALLERCIKASCPENGVVLDPFCGCGTAVVAAQSLGRQWIGIDITHLAINLIKIRLRDAFPEPVPYRVIGEPTSVPDAQDLAASDPWQFQWWALGLVGARPADQKRGADRGIDGRISFLDEDRDTVTKHVIISVKAGQTGVAHVHELRGVIEREHAEIGVLITMQEPTGPMRVDANAAGFYESSWGSHPRLQLLTIADLLAGGRINMPPLRQVDRTFRKAPRARTTDGRQRELL